MSCFAICILANGLYVCIYIMYVCIYVFMYVCMYVCMYICMYVCMLWMYLLQAVSIALDMDRRELGYLPANWSSQGEEAVRAYACHYRPRGWSSWCGSSPGDGNDTENASRNDPNIGGKVPDTQSGLSCIRNNNLFSICSWYYEESFYKRSLYGYLSSHSIKSW